jgi:hypothetical protein
MRPRRWIDGLFLKVYLKAETVGVAVSGMRLCMRSLDGGGRGSAEMEYFVLIKVDIARPDKGFKGFIVSCPSELATVRMRLSFRLPIHFISSSSRTLLRSSLYNSPQMTVTRPLLSSSVPVSAWMIANYSYDHQCGERWHWPTHIAANK